VLQDWLDKVQDCDDSIDDEAKEFGGLIAFYQIER
jgi:hypothetical protein